MCCLPIAGSEQLNDKAADQPQAAQTGSGGEEALGGEEGAAQDGPIPTRPLNRGEQKLNLSINPGRPELRALRAGHVGVPLCPGSRPGRAPPCQRGCSQVMAGPSDHALASPQSGSRQPFPLLHVAFPGAQHTGFPSPREPQPTFAAGVPPTPRRGGSKVTLNTGTLCRDALIWRRRGVTPQEGGGAMFSEPRWGAKCISSMCQVRSLK